MKKKVQLIVLLTIIQLFVCFLLKIEDKNVQIQIEKDGGPFIHIVTDFREENIYPWFNEIDSKYYFFLPSFCQGKSIYAGDLRGKVVLWDGKQIKRGTRIDYQENNICNLKIVGTERKVYDIVIMKSDYLPAIFIQTDSGGMDYLHQNKMNEESGNIHIIKSNGRMEYGGRLKISGRGNSSWEEEKKPYLIKLGTAKALLGMDSGKRWCLLAGWNEGAKLNTKIAFDMAEEIGLAYSPQCVWADLYLNGEYAGIYLLSETVSVGEGRVDIFDLEKENQLNYSNIEDVAVFEENRIKGYVLESKGEMDGGYLLEKDCTDYWEKEKAGFITEQGNCFSIKSPQSASREQVTYIYDYTQRIDDMISSGNKEYRKYIDFDSFVKKFIVDEIALSHDVNITSMFYYKEKNDDLLYAGPVWDFDGAFGETNSGWAEGIWVDYTWSSTKFYRGEEINWYSVLYEDEAFKTLLVETYKGFLPYLEEILEERIDQYAALIRKSVEMDRVRWKNVDISGDKPGHYVEFDNNVKYLKYYLANRLNYLNQIWKISYKEFLTPKDKTLHKIMFVRDGEIVEERAVQDGYTIEELPYLDEEKYWGWYFSYSDEKYRNQLPIYEDVVFYARER